mgnify:CR=1 FL=1|tara:strand:+ start:53 stop:340 length:288 start_codon:yes stop_codon:yes gene_type:complete
MFKKKSKTTVNTNKSSTNPKIPKMLSGMRSVGRIRYRDAIHSAKINFVLTAMRRIRGKERLCATPLSRAGMSLTYKVVRMYYFRIDDRDRRSVDQ